MLLLPLDFAAHLLTLPKIVTSFMSNFTKSRDSSQSSPIEKPSTPIQAKPEPFPSYDSRPDSRSRGPMTPVTSSPLTYHEESNESPQQRQRASSRPMSMVQTFQPPLMDVSQDTLPELQPIFTFLNSHGNKLYQEGYFLKLDDQDTCT
jgi:CCR4-NOT transcriptional complex subunit CAF120